MLFYRELQEFRYTNLHAQYFFFLSLNDANPSETDTLNIHFYKGKIFIYSYSGAKKTWTIYIFFYKQPDTFFIRVDVELLFDDHFS